MKSDSLHILVQEAGQTKVSLSFNAGAAAILAALVPPGLRPRLEARGINLTEIADKAKAQDYIPGELFKLEDGAKTVRVWLE